MKTIILIVCAIFAFSGCTVAVDEVDQDQQEPVAQVEQESHSVNCSISSYTRTTNGTTTMQPASTHFCWLTRFSGSCSPISANAPTVYVSGSNWVLADGTGTTVKGACAPLSCFSGNGTNDVKWISSSFQTYANALPNCVTSSNTTWWGDAATVLNGGGSYGNWAGGGEYAQVVQSTNWQTGSTLKSHDCYYDGAANEAYAGVAGLAYSLFVGTPNAGWLAWFDGPGGNNASINVAGTYSVSSNSSVDMSFIDQSICYFVELKGDFNGGGENVEISQVWNSGAGKYQWRLSAAHGSGSGVSAKANCYRYHQWTL